MASFDFEVEPNIICLSGSHAQLCHPAGPGAADLAPPLPLVGSQEPGEIQGQVGLGQGRWGDSQIMSYKPDSFRSRVGVSGLVTGWVGQLLEELLVAPSLAAQEAGWGGSQACPLWRLLTALSQLPGLRWASRHWTLARHCLVPRPLGNEHFFARSVDQERISPKL